MTKNNETVKDDSPEILKWILGQNFRAIKRKRKLDKRLLMIYEERESPIGGQGYDPLPRSSGGTPSGAASITMKLAEIEDRIYHQKEAIDKAIVNTMDILDYLPPNSLERDICEMRHIDLMPWADIQADIPMSRSQCNKRYNKAINTLLQNGRIRRIVEDHRADYDEYVCSRTLARGRREQREQEHRKEEASKRKK